MIIIVSILLFTLPLMIVIYFCFFARRSTTDNEGFTYRLCKRSECGTNDVLRVEKSLLSQSECRQIIEFAKKKGMRRSQVRDFEEDDTTRRSETQWISPSDIDVVHKLYKKITDMTGQDSKNFEPLQVVHYTKNGYFRSHYDQCDSSDEWCVHDVRRFNGVRYMTLLIYLNNEFTGGETEFPRLKKKLRPETGDAILFYNTNHKKTCVLPDSLHQGNDIQSGEKWIANVWIRSPPVSTIPSTSNSTHAADDGTAQTPT